MATKFDGCWFSHSNHTHILRAQGSPNANRLRAKKTYLRLKTKCILVFSAPFADIVFQVEFLPQTCIGDDTSEIMGRDMEDAT